MYPLDGGRRLAQQQAQQQAIWRAQRRAAVDAYMRQDSVERARPKPQQPEWMRQLTAKRVSPNGPMPRDVWVQFEAGNGRWAVDGVTAFRHGSEQLEIWLEIWLTCTVAGGLVLEQQQEQQQKRLRAQELAEDRKRQERANKAARRAYQERYRLDKGEVVRIKQSQSELDGRLGRVLRMEWEGDVLWAWVSVERLPPGHPGLSVELRRRPHEWQPIAHQLKAECLTREHPEAVM